MSARPLMAWIAISVPLVLLALAMATVPLIWGTLHHSREEQATRLATVEPRHTARLATVEPRHTARSGKSAA